MNSSIDLSTAAAAFLIMRSQLLLQFLLLAFALAAEAADISPGSSLYASKPNQTWASPNSTFSLGFSQEGPSSYKAAIFYVGGVPIWTAGGSGSSAGIVDAGGALRFLSNGNLQLVNGSDSVIWQSNTTNLGITSASLSDSGNLVLQKGNVSVWSSFENPTDCIVPSQDFTVNQTLSSGVYSFSILRSGNLTLTWNESIVYWNQAPSFAASNLTSPSLELQSNGILSLSDPNLETSLIVAYSNDYGEGTDVLRFLRLESDGNFRMYSSSRGSGNTSMTWAALADQCEVYGYCGNMGICSYNDSSSNPICGCPSQNFELVDVNDSRKGCKRKVALEDCTGSVTLLELDHTKFLTFQVDQMVIIGITACRSNCLQGGSCVASSSLADGTGYCYLKTPDFVSGYQSPVLPSTSYVKVCGAGEPNPTPSMEASGENKCWRARIWVISSAIVVASLCLFALLGGLWWRYHKNSPRYQDIRAQYTLLEYASGAPVQFSYKELRQSTKGFQEKLGEGGFGAVYRGVIANRMAVAVKQLVGIEQGEKQFRMEVATISSTHHLNLVRLIGFCSEGRHRLLVYEFMKNGSLDSFLFVTEEQQGSLLNWGYRFKIALGTARGITYLHEECHTCIVHCDIKPENILLDENYNAKVSDFGLAKLISSKDQRHRSMTSVRGTRGYLAPEWLTNLPITSKSDVYSYGMVLLEIVSGRRNFEVSAEANEKKFSEWAYEEFEKGNIEAIVDRRLSDQDTDMDQATRAIKVSFWCIQEHPSGRPTMGNVLQMLEGVKEIPRPPAPKALASPKALAEDFNSGTTINLSSKDSACSTFEASAPGPSSSSSSQAVGATPLASHRNMEKESSSFLKSSQRESH